ncbi:ornithine carbamoyltransferase [Candidatus Bipolaricaulota bacterium]|nr:ornithine carbamoyltransferase [Candidatus Bipolaricaulota bacterium]
MSWHDLKGKDMISVKDWTKEELDILLRVANDLKSRYYSGEEPDILENDTFMMLFFNSSTRTRQSFEAGMSQLGGHSQFLAPETMRISLDREPGGGESIKDTTRVMGRYAEGVGVRILEDKVNYYGQGTEIMYEMGKYSTVPIINMASDIYHPCQSMTDVMTMQEKVGDLKDKKIAVTWAYSPWVRSWGSIQSNILTSALFGMDVSLAHPEGYELDPDVLDMTEENAKKSGGSFSVTNDMEEAVEDADIVYPRNWMSPDRYEIGKEKEIEMAGQHEDWKYTKEKQEELGDPGYLLHCMPVDRGNEVEDEIMDDPELSFVYDQAENRLHLQKALMALTMGGNF